MPETELHEKRSAETRVTLQPEFASQGLWTRVLVLMALTLTGIGCAHTQRPESRIHVISETAEGVGTFPGSGGAGGHDCQKEHEECIDRCWKNRYPWPHSKEQGGWYYERCLTTCREEFNECTEEQEQAAREREEREKKLKFSRMDDAIDWLRNHKAEVALGTVVIVAGVAFVLTTGGSGALILAPLAL